MRTDREKTGVDGLARAAIFGLALAALVPACNRPQSVEAEGEQDSTEEVVEKERSATFVDPLLGAPWLGHADDGALVKVEFFVSDDSDTTLCRTSIEELTGPLPTTRSSFSASEQLETITWSKGKSRAKYNAETQTLEAKVVTDLKSHEVVLKQVSVDDHPELATFRKTIPDNERTRAVLEKFNEKLGRGTRWWKSNVGWDSLITPPEEIVADGDPTVLIRPEGVKLPKLPAIDAGGHLNFPIICHLPPGTTIALDNLTVGVVAELHYNENVQATWILQDINPGAVVQNLTAHWVSAKGEEPPTGEASLFVYLADAPAKENIEASDLSKPFSNLLKIELVIGSNSADPAEGSDDDPEADSGDE